MLLKNTFGALALVGSLTVAGGCVVSGHARVAEPVAVVEVDEEPPPPRAVVIETRPGFVFIEGRWVRNGGRWVWRDGYYERERVGYRWEKGRWDTRGNRHVWVEGGWRSGGGPAVRDHREERREDSHVRDHR
jgi:hypothetical protein